MTMRPERGQPGDRSPAQEDPTLSIDPAVQVDASRSPNVMGDDEVGVERRSLELREEELTARKELVPAGTVHVRREVEERPAQLEVQALRDEVQLEHVPMGQEVSERVAPWDEEGVTVIPVYEEQLVVVKRLVLKEHVRVRHVQRTETRLVEDTVRRERVVVEDPDKTGQVRELYPTDVKAEEEKPGGNLLERAMRKALD